MPRSAVASGAARLFSALGFRASDTCPTASGGDNRARLDQQIENFALLVNGTPQVHAPAGGSPNRGRPETTHEGALNGLAAITPNPLSEQLTNI
jgi:hypothetical protein